MEMDGVTDRLRILLERRTDEGDGWSDGQMNEMNGETDR